MMKSLSDICNNNDLSNIYITDYVPDTYSEQNFKTILDKF